MSSLEGRAIAWLNAHHSTITGDALDSAGITLDQRKELVRAGILCRVIDDVYVLASVAVTEVVKCIAVGHRPGLVIAGPTAARLWQLRRAPNDGLTHVIGPPVSQPCRAPWLRVYRTSALFPDEVVHDRRCFDVTTPTRTVIDSSRYLDRAATASMIEDALAKRVCTSDDLWAGAERLRSRGRPWVKRFLLILSGRMPGSAVDSSYELKLFDALLAAGIGGITRQFKIRIPGYGPASFDLAIEALRLDIEVDVHPEHRTIEGSANDRRRDDGAEQLGWHVRRIPEGEFDDIPKLVDSLKALIARRRAAFQMR